MENKCWSISVDDNESCAEIYSKFFWLYVTRNCLPLVANYIFNWSRFSYSVCEKVESGISSIDLTKVATGGVLWKIFF